MMKQQEHELIDKRYFVGRINCSAWGMLVKEGERV
jgi:hypothetical protein